jgi:hypothetical protein
MHYCTRSPERTAFRKRIAASAFSSRVHFHFDDGPESQKLQLNRLLTPMRPGVHLYVCGPKGFMDWLLEAARVAGWPAQRLHYEFFGAQIIKSEDDASFEVKLASTGKVVVVPKDKTVVQALACRRSRDRHIVRAGRVRYLSDSHSRRRARPQGRVFDAGGTGRQRPVHALLFTRKFSAARARFVTAPRRLGGYLEHSSTH